MQRLAIADAGTMPSLHPELGARPVSMKICLAEMYISYVMYRAKPLPGNCVYLRQQRFLKVPGRSATE